MIRGDIMEKIKFKDVVFRQLDRIGESVGNNNSFIQNVNFLESLLSSCLSENYKKRVNPKRVKNEIPDFRKEAEAKFRALMKEIPLEV